MCFPYPGDLPRMASSKFLFANKFRLHQDRVAVSCLEEMLANHTRDYFVGKREMLDVTQYSEMDIVKNMIVNDPHKYDRDSGGEEKVRKLIRERGTQSEKWGGRTIVNTTS